MNWKKQCPLATGGWVDLTKCDRVAYGFNYSLDRTATGNFVMFCPPVFGNGSYYEVSEEQAFDSLMVRGKQSRARRYFPQRYEAWKSSGQR